MQRLITTAEVGTVCPFTYYAACNFAVCPGEVGIDSSGSSQFISGLLLISLKLPSGSHLAQTGVEARAYRIRTTGWLM